MNYCIEFMYHCCRVLFEISLESPKFEFDGKFQQGKLYYEEFWRSK